MKPILAFEQPETPPELYRFAVRILDPYDPLRGRYVRLNLENSRVRLPRKNLPLCECYGSPSYAMLEWNADGTARVANPALAQQDIPPGKGFVKVRYNWFQWDYEKLPTGAKRRPKRLTTGVHLYLLSVQPLFSERRNDSGGGRIAVRAQKARESVRRGQDL